MQIIAQKMLQGQGGGTLVCSAHLEDTLLAAGQLLGLGSAPARHGGHQPAGRALAVVAGRRAGVAAGQHRAAHATAAKLVPPAALVRHHSPAEARRRHYPGAGRAGACAGAGAGSEHVRQAGASPTPPGKPAACLAVGCASARGDRRGSPGSAQQGEGQVPARRALPSVLSLTWVAEQHAWVPAAPRGLAAQLATAAGGMSQGLRVTGRHAAWAG